MERNRCGIFGTDITTFQMKFIPPHSRIRMAKQAAQQPFFHTAGLPQGIRGNLLPRATVRIRFAQGGFRPGRPSSRAKVFLLRGSALHTICAFLPNIGPVFSSIGPYYAQTTYLFPGPAPPPFADLIPPTGLHCETGGRNRRESLPGIPALLTCGYS